jgi:circadian clock protein KaiC
MTSTSLQLPEKIETGIYGFDQIAQGGLPRNRSTLVAGTAGSGKTTFAMQFIAAGILQYDEPGVIVTFEDTPTDLFANIRSFGWRLDEALVNKRLAVVDATPVPGDAPITAGNYDLSALAARIESAIRKVGARRIMMDSVGSLFPQFSEPMIVRRELHRILNGLRRTGVTSVVTLERTEEEGGIGRFGVEEFVADNVVLLRNRLEQEKRRRTIEILKFRGTLHQKGEYPFTIDPQDGVTILPLSSIELKQHSSNIRVPSGSAELDTMCGGGFYRDSIILVSGATGTGKTLTTTHFINAAIANGERALLIASEESREQLTRNARVWNMDFEKAERDGLLRIACRYPEAMGLEDHMLHAKRDLEDFKPSRVAVDSITAFERVSTPKSFREFIIGMTSAIKHMEITGMFSNTTTMLGSGESVTDTHFSTLTDTIILLRYVELYGHMHRGLTVLKMRGTWHDKEIREYTIDGNGMHIGKPFRGVHGILVGTPSVSLAHERERLQDMFDHDATMRAKGGAVA